MPLEPNVEVKAEGSNVTIEVQESYAVEASGKLVQVYVDTPAVNVHIEESVVTSQVAGIVNIHNTYTGGVLAEISADPDNALAYGNDGKLFSQQFEWTTTQW